jgi:hypothetical protein
MAGRATVLVGIDGAGRVISMEVYEMPSPILEASAVFTAMQSVFRPAILRCVAVPSTVALAIDF